MGAASVPSSTISARALLERVAGGAVTTILDVRDDASEAIEGPGVETLHVPAPDVIANAGALARDLPADTVVVCRRGFSAQAAAGALQAAGLPARVLDGGMRAWIGVLRAVPVELGISGLTVLQVQRPGRGCLSYMLAAGDEALVVDPADDPCFYIDLAGDLGARIVGVVDTHLHADHLSGARELARRTGAALRLPDATRSRGIAYAGDGVALRDGDTMFIGPVEIRALALPGHTTDMTGLLVAGRALLSGDSLFADGIARPDLQRGDRVGARAMARVLHATLHDRVLALDDDVVLLPGHDHPGVRTAAVAPTLGAVRACVAELAIADADAFAEAVLADLPRRPVNYLAVIDANAGRRAPDPELEQGGNSCATR